MTTLLPTMRTNWRLGLMCLLLAGCGGVSISAVYVDDDSKDPVAIPYQEILPSVDSAINDPRFVVIRDLTTWDALWNAHTAHLSPRPERPAVNFSQNMVIGVFLGSHNNSCYRVSIDAIWRFFSPSRIEVTYRETVPSASDICATVMTNPAALVVAPYSNLPVEFYPAN